MKHAVLIHGCHLQTDGWLKVAMGDPKSGSLGRISKGILEAYKRKADLIYFGTGASEIDGVKESEFTYKTALINWRELARMCGADDSDPHGSPFTQWLQEVSFVDIESQNTDEEIRRCLEVCTQRGIETLTLVSSPFHILRCMQLAAVVLEGQTDESLRKIAQNLSAVASDTNPDGLSTADVVIVEPAHRGDNPKVPFYKQVRRLFQFLRKPDLAFELNDELTKLIDDFEKKL